MWKSHLTTIGSHLTGNKVCFWREEQLAGGVPHPTVKLKNCSTPVSTTEVTSALFPHAFRRCFISLLQTAEVRLGRHRGLHCNRRYPQVLLHMILPGLLEDKFHPFDETQKTCWTHKLDILLKHCVGCHLKTEKNETGLPHKTSDSKKKKRQDGEIHKP